MKHYRDYMDAQRVSERLHEELLARKPSAKKRGSWTRWGALAACCALLLGVGAWRLAPAASGPEGSQSAGQFATGYEPKPGESDVVGPEDPLPNPILEPSDLMRNDYNFLADSGQEGGQINMVMVPSVAFPALSRGEELAVAPDYAYGLGAFSVGLTQRDISRLLGQGEEQSNVPWLLGWDNYVISGKADYDGQGNLREVTIWGVGEDDFFTLRMAPGRMPLTCVVRTDAAATDVRGVEVNAWQTSYDYDGDGELETLYKCAFLAHDVGIQFTVCVCPGGEAAGARRAELLVNWCSYADCPLTLEHLLVNENIPAWRSEEYKSYAPLLQEVEFAPYLPAQAPAGFGEFQGYLTYQEGSCNTVHAIWLKGYDDMVSIAVFLPEGEPEEVAPIDITRPETYDTRLYSIPWCDSVPEELIHYFLSPPVFRAEDMSLEVIKARMTPHDTGGESCAFKVLHENGVLVSYDCDGLTAEQVWSIVEATL